MTATWTPADQQNLDARLRVVDSRWIPDEEDAYLDAEQPLHRCGWGGDPRCSQMLPARGLCDEHSAILQEAAFKVGLKRRPRHFKRAPDSVIQQARADRVQRDEQVRAEERQQRAERREKRTGDQYRAQIKADALARQAQDAQRIAEYVADAGRPVGRAEVFEALNLAEGGHGPRAVKYAKAAGLIAVDRRRYVIPESS